VTIGLAHRPVKQEKPLARPPRKERKKRKKEKEQKEERRKRGREREEERLHNEPLNTNWGAVPRAHTPAPPSSRVMPSFAQAGKTGSGSRPPSTHPTVAKRCVTPKPGTCHGDEYRGSGIGPGYSRGPYTAIGTRQLGPSRWQSTPSTSHQSPAHATTTEQILCGPGQSNQDLQLDALGGVPPGNHLSRTRHKSAPTIGSRTRRAPGPRVHQGLGG
jgi:hypothetical protein